MLIDKKIENLDLLIEKFNKRDDVAFGQIYYLLYNELYHFTSGLYRDTPIGAKDVMQDVYIKIWESETPKFNDIKSLKSYLYVAVKNKFRNYIDHRKSIAKYNEDVRFYSDNFVSNVVETEALSIINQALNLLPEECAKVFKLVVDGWEIKDIAKELDKAESTVYAQKQKAIEILKKKLSKHSFVILMMTTI